MPSATVLQLSDTHLRADPSVRVYERDPDARVASVLRAWAATGERADLVLLSGDLADDGSLAACRRLADAVAVLGCPVLAIPGNHDLPAAVAATWPGPSDIAVGAWRLVGIDTTIPGEIHGAVDVAAVTARLDALPPDPTIVALHHPPRSRSTGPMFRLEGSDDLLAALGTRPHVRAVVAGHLHDAVELDAAGGLPILGAPSTLMAIAHHGDEMLITAEGTTGARILHLHDDGTLTTEILAA